ncbi:MAG: C39 family peptidase [Candidatus Sericytochromatia bacterium]|nr:C39 family peptidase [Candidatus Sericytochromatia bacterium]
MTDPLRTGATGPVRPTAGATRPNGPVAEGAPPAPDQFGALTARPLLYRPAPLLDSASRPGRPFAPWVQDRVESVVNAVFAQLRTRTAGAPLRTDTGWDPASQVPLDNGALPAAPGRPVPGAPAPGAGEVKPAGLLDGNTLLRYNADGQPTNYTLLDQGPTNGCGTTSLAMILNYFAGGRADYSREEVDRFIRHNELFTSPSDVAEFAEKRGFEASVHIGTTPDDLRRMVDAGLPVQILIDASKGERGTGLHYEVVTGYGTGPDGKRYFELTNPWGNREYMAEDVLMRKWTNVKAGPVPTALDRVAIVMKPPGHPAVLPVDHRDDLQAASVALRIAQGLTQISSGWSRGEPLTVLAGLVRGLAGGLAGLPAVLLAPVHRFGDGLIGSGREALKQGGWEAAAGGLKLVAGLAVRAAILPIEAVANVASLALDKAGSAIKAAGDTIKGWFR